MNINLTEETNRRMTKPRLSKMEFETSCVTDVDTEIGKNAYWCFGLREYEQKTDISSSLVLSTAMVALEKMLAQLHKQPCTDLLDNDPKGNGNFVPLKPSERRFKEAFLLGLPEFVRLTKDLPTECRFSPAMEVFIECCRDFNVEECIRATDGLRVRDRRYFGPQIRCINDFYWKLKERLSNPSLRRKIRDHIWQIEINSRRFQSYVDSMFQVYARLVVIRLDLEYREKHKPSLSEATSDIDRFFSNGRHNKLFYALCGFICKVEFGIYNGYHFHVILFFDGSKRSNHADNYLAKQFGEYWKKVITQGKGRYWNANGDKDRYVKNGRLGIGAIHARETPIISNLKAIVRYFCKKDQFFRPVGEPKFKTIRKGHAPILTGKKLGRPRISTE